MAFTPFILKLFTMMFSISNFTRVIRYCLTAKLAYNNVSFTQITSFIALSFMLHYFFRTQNLLTPLALIFAMIFDISDQLKHDWINIHEFGFFSMAIRTSRILFNPALNTPRAKDLIVALVTFNWTFILRYKRVTNTTQKLFFEVFHIISVCLAIIT